MVLTDSITRTARWRSPLRSRRRCRGWIQVRAVEVVSDDDEAVGIGRHGLDLEVRLEAEGESARESGANPKMTTRAPTPPKAPSSTPPLSVGAAGPTV